MGFGRLSLVKPCRFSTHECYARASGANDVLDQAQVSETLAAAIEDCTLVVGTSARSRSLSWPIAPLRETAQRCAQLPRSQQIAIVFGRERSGLSNDELALCGAQLTIPSSETFSSLNLAAAIQVVAYELRCALDEQYQRPVPPAEDDAIAAHGELENLYAHLQQTMANTGFMDPQQPRMLMPRLRRLFARSEPRLSEVRLLRGFLSSVDKLCEKQ